MQTDPFNTSKMKIPKVPVALLRSAASLICLNIKTENQKKSILEYLNE